MFPVSIWIPHAYPRESPMAFVTPTRDMAVRPGQHVSIEGRIFHPYLASWRPDVRFSSQISLAPYVLNLVHCIGLWLTF